jgi:ABC-type transport system substrate-binding protein
VQWTDPASLQYAVYSSQKYDMALVGWRLSEYPGYLCEWFGVGARFENPASRLGSACEALALEPDLEAARVQVFEIQSILTEEVPFVPVYEQGTQDVFQNVTYPFEGVLGGLSGLYGAPSYAIPAK